VFSVLIGAGLLLFGFGELVTQIIYQRRFDPRADIDFLSVGLDLLFPGGREDLYQVIAIIVLSVVAVGIAVGMALTIRKALRPTRGVAAIVGGALLPIAATLMFTGFADGPLARAVTVQPDEIEVRDVSASIVAPTPLPQAPSGDDSLRFRFPGIRDADIHLFFVESYGATAFTNQRLAEPLDPVLSRMESLLSDEGYSIASRFLVSPVSGGYSWIAEATLLTGRWVGTQIEYDSLLKTDATNIPRHLQESGYFTIASMPAIVKEEWPEGMRFYGYSDHLYSWDFDYHGPMFSYVAVPDQFTLWKTHNALERLRGEAPVFAQYVLVSSHAPFNIIPAFVEEWSELGGGSGYEQRETLYFDNGWLRGNEYDEGYVAAISYVLETITDYIISFVRDGSIVILVGDHQPKRPVRELSAGKEVPIHVISRNDDVIERFVELGYARGVNADDLASASHMHEFFGHFFTVIGTPHADSQTPH